MAYPDDPMPDASTIGSGLVGGPLWNTFIVNPLNALRARLLGTGPAASGSATTPSGSAGVPTTIAVTFPAGRFSTPPNVQVTANGTASSTVVGVGVQSITTTGCTLWCTRSSPSTTLLNWFAMATT